MNDAQIRAPSRLDRLRTLLEADPSNLSLLDETASCAFEEGRLEMAEHVLRRRAGIGPLPDEQVNLSGLIAMRQGRFQDAAEQFSQLNQRFPDDPVIRQNLAWAHYALDAPAAALDLLDVQTDATPRGALLRVRVLHSLGEIERALNEGRVLAERHRATAELQGAMALVAIDAEQMELAGRYAARAGDLPDGLSTLGFIATDRQDLAGALDLFDRALAVAPHDPRALLGKGVTLMAADRPAADCLDQAAQGFQTHLGSWIAAGWAHLKAGDADTARARFETALALDGAFAESHGALAVLDLMDDRMDSAKRRMEVALRLDPKCLSAALARIMMLSTQGEERRAQVVLEKALAQPLGTDGRTLGQSIAVFAAVGGRRLRSEPGR